MLSQASWMHNLWCFYLAVFYATKHSVVRKGLILFFLWPCGLFQLLRCSMKLGFVVLMFQLWGWKIGSPDWTRTKAQTKTCHKQESLSQSSECSNVTSSSAEGFSGCMPSKPFTNPWTTRPISHWKYRQHPNSHRTSQIRTLSIGSNSVHHTIEPPTED